jgi:hypothetical protein
MILLSFPIYIYAYSFNAAVNNTQAMLGDEIELTLTFTYDNLEEYEIEEPHFEPLTSTLVKEVEYQEDNGTWIVQQTYALVAQKVGKIHIPMITVHIEKIPQKYQNVYNRNKYLEKIDIHSNVIKLRVLPLPEGLHISGNYQLFATVDKQNVLSGLPVTFQLRVKGKGNLNSLDFFTLNIPHTTIYQKRISPFKKSFSIIADKNYTIPSVTLKYYNQESHSIDFINTPIYHIAVHTQHTPITLKTFDSMSILSIILLCILLIYMYILIKKIEYLDEKTYLIISLKQCKTEESLLKKVIPYMHKSKALTRLIYKLETCNKQNFKLIKQDIIQQIYVNL